MRGTIHVLQILGAPAGGIRRHVHSIILGLRSMPDIRQSYACSGSDGDAGYRKDLVALQEVLEGRLLDLKITKKPGFSDITNIIRLIRYIKDNNIGLAHGHGAKGGAYARILAGICGIKAVYTPHGGSVHKMFGPLEEMIYTSVEKLLFRFTAHFLFESKYSAEAYFAKVGKKPKNWLINYNGVPLPDLAAIQKESQTLGYAPGTPEILHIGVFGILRPQKGQLYAIKAAAVLLSQGVQVKLHIYGTGTDEPVLRDEVARLGLKDTVIFHGEVDYPEAHMFAMDMILIPSLFEAFGYVAIEAFSMQKTVVASSVGGLKEIITDGINGLLVAPGNHLAITGALLRLSKDAGLRSRLGSAGRERFISDFTEERMVKRINEIYAGLAAYNP